jgi:hypothetical protein
MISLLTFFGHPFDPSLDNYWMEPSKSYNRSKEVGKWLTSTKIVNSGSFRRILSEISTNPQFELEIFGKRIDDVIDCLQNTNPELNLLSFYASWLDEKNKHAELILAKKTSKDLIRYFHYHQDYYHEEFITYLHTGSKRAAISWYYKGLQCFSQNHSARLFPDGVNFGSINVYEAVKEIIPKEQLRSFNLLADFLIFQVNSKELGVLYFSTLLYIFDCLNKKIDVTNAVISAWTIAYMSKSHEVFGLVMYHFKDIVEDEKAFPLLNRSFFNVFFQYLDSTSPVALRNYDHELVFSTFGSSILPKASNMDDPSDAFCFLLDYINRVDLDFKSNNVSSLKYQTEMLTKLLEDELPDLANEMIIVEPITDERAVPLHLNDLKNTLDQYVFFNLPGLFDKHQKLIDEFEADSAAINEKAAHLAKAPLDNIDELKTLADQKKSLQAILDTGNANLRQQLINYINCFNDIVNKHNDTGLQPPSENDIELHELRTQLSNMKHEIELLNALNTESNHKINELNRDKKLLNDQISKFNAKISIEEPKATNDLDMLLGLLESKNQLLYIVQSIVQARPWVKISDKLLKSLDEVSNFARVADFAKQLSMLTSLEFIQAVNEKGSLGGFEFFTKQALSFKESLTTMRNDSLRRQRQFPFDGKQITIEPHLKIGVNNTEQEQMRIYFLIDGPVIYLGYIGRHLPTSSE